MRLAYALIIGSPSDDNTKDKKNTYPPLFISGACAGSYNLVQAPEFVVNTAFVSIRWYMEVLTFSHAFLLGWVKNGLKSLLYNYATQPLHSTFLFLSDLNCCVHKR